MSSKSIPVVVSDPSALQDAFHYAMAACPGRSALGYESTFSGKDATLTRTAYLKLAFLEASKAFGGFKFRRTSRNLSAAETLAREIFEHAARLGYCANGGVRLCTECKRNQADHGCNGLCHECKALHDSQDSSLQQWIEYAIVEHNAGRVETAKASASLLFRTYTDSGKLQILNLALNLHPEENDAELVRCLAGIAGSGDSATDVANRAR